MLKNNVKNNHKLTEDDLISKRPGTGICTTYWDNVIGLRVKTDLKEDHILNWEDLQIKK